MRRHAKILLAGTLVAILPCGAATSQTLSPVLNDQLQLGDVLANGTLDVVEVTDQTTQTTTATANSFDATVDGGDLEVTSNQALQANVTATTTVNVASGAGAATTLNTAATGNTGDAGVFGGYLSGSFVQTTDPTAITATSQMEAGNARAGDISSSVQAIGNSQGFGVTYGASNVTAAQANDASITADGGGVVQYVEGTSIFSAAAAANNVTAASAGGSSQEIAVSQDNTAALVQAGQFTSYGNAYVTTTSATATGNNITAGNEGPYLGVTSQQQNLAYVRAEAVNSAYQFGGGSAVAYGVGNSVLAGNAGEEVVLDSDQFNDGGGIEVIAGYTGYEGYDGTASASAIGNASSAYACSDCFGGMTVTNSQTNATGVSATSSVSITSGRSANGVASAIGNTASYYVSRQTQ